MADDEQANKMLINVLEALDKKEEDRVSKDSFIITKFMSSYIGLQAFKNQMGFSIYRYFTNKLKYKAFEPKDLLWHNLNFREKIQERDKMMIDGKPLCRTFNVLLQGKIMVRFTNKSRYETHVIEKLQNNISLKTLRRYGLNNVVDVRAFSHCHCLVISQDDAEELFPNPRSNEFKISLPKKFTFLEKFDLLSGINERDLINIALTVKCQQLSIRSFAYKKGAPVKSLYLIYDGIVEIRKDPVIEEKRKYPKDIFEKFKRKKVDHRKKMIETIQKKKKFFLMKSAKKKIQRYMANQYFGHLEYLGENEVRATQSLVVTEKCKLLVLDFESLEKYIPELKEKLEEKLRDLEKLKGIHNSRTKSMTLSKDSIDFNDPDNPKTIQTAKKWFHTKNFPRGLISMNKEDLLKKSVAVKMLHENESNVDKVMANFSVEKKKQMKKIALLKTISKTKNELFELLNRSFGEKIDELEKYEMSMDRRRGISLRKHPRKKNNQIFTQENKILDVDDNVFFDYKDFLTPSEVRKLNRKKRRENIKYEQEKKLREAIQSMRWKQRNNSTKKITVLDSIDYLNQLRGGSMFYSSKGFKTMSRATNKGVLFSHSPSYYGSDEDERSGSVLFDASSIQESKYQKMFRKRRGRVKVNKTLDKLVGNLSYNTNKFLTEGTEKKQKVKAYAFGASQKKKKARNQKLRKNTEKPASNTMKKRSRRCVSLGNGPIHSKSTKRLLPAIPKMLNLDLPVNKVNLLEANHRSLKNLKSNLANTRKGNTRSLMKIFSKNRSNPTANSPK